MGDDRVRNLMRCAVVALWSALACAGDEAASRAEVEGLLAPARVAELALDVHGRVAERPVEIGRAVNVGTPLLQLGARELHERVALATLRSASNLEVEIERVSLRRAGDELARLKSLDDDAVASPKELADAHAAVELAELRLSLAERRRREAERELALSQAQLAGHTLLAPFDGFVTQVHKEIGEAVEPGEPLVRVAQLDRLRVVCYWPLERRAQLRVGGRLAVVADGSAERAAAEIVRVDREVDPASQTLRVELEVDNRDGRWLAGQRVRIESAEPAAARGGRSADGEVQGAG